jgi:hypothetical protein
MLRRIDAQAEALETLSFPVLGLPSPHRAPVALTGSSGSNGRIESVELTFGDRAEPTGPVVVVRTRRADAGTVPSASTPGPVSRTAGGERVESSTQVVIEGSPVAARLIETNSAWTLHATATLDGVAMVVDVEGRAVSPRTVALVKVTDFGPFVAAQRERIENLRSQPPAPGPESWDLPLARGLEAHEKLVEMCSHVQRPEPGQRPSPLPPQWAQSWEAATRAQMALAGEDRRSAEDAVHSLVNHLTQITSEAPWFGDQGLAALATSETIAYVARREHVASLPAQRAWTEYWTSRVRPRGGEPLSDVPSPTEIEHLRTRIADSERLRSAWLAAWSSWAEQQRH